MKYFLLVVCTLFMHGAFSQNLIEERIWKVPDRKKAIYLSQGVFHHNTSGQSSVLKKLRSSYVKSRGYERVVIDFEGNDIPRIYGHISGKDKRLAIDFFNSLMDAGLNSLKGTKYVKSIDFLSIDEGQVTMEMNLKSQVTFDIFYLKNPGRLVIDIRP